MASQNQNPQDETTIDKVNTRLTEAGTKIADNRKYIFWGICAVVVVAVFILCYLFFYRNPHTQKSYDAYNKVEISAVNDSVAAVQYKQVEIGRAHV